MYRIYALKNPINGDIGYVGCTTSTLRTRLRELECRARRRGKYRIDRWIQGLLEVGLRPEIVLLEETADPLREKFWIDYYRKSGVTLMNESDGGPGDSGRVGTTFTLTWEQRKRLSEAMKGNQNALKFNRSGNGC